MRLNQTILVFILAYAPNAFAWQTPQPGPNSSGAIPGGQSLQPAIFTSRTAFRIPYQHDAREVARLGSKEIRLYVSRDNGQNWFQIQSVAPETGRFDFRAEADGEYWFAVRTVDHQGQLHPGGKLQPGLSVAVDTRKPLLKIDLSQPSPGRVALSWVTVDENVAPDGVQLEFSQSGIPDWQPVGTRPAASGQTSWTVPAGGTVAVRGRARDRAGNETSAQYQIQVQAAGAYGTSPGPIGAPSTIPGSLDPRIDTPRFPGPGPGPVPTPSPLGPPDRSVAGFPPSPVPDAGHGVPPVRGQYPGGNTGLPPNPFRPAPAPARTGPSADSPVWRDAHASAIPGTGDVPNFSSQLPGHRTVQSRQFQIDYQVDDVGPSGIAAVELFVTQNNGEKWYRYGVDEDRQSPFDVDVPADGVYGFAMRVVSGAGLTDPPPQPGQKPDIVIEVDASPPVVQLFPLKQGQGAQSNRILISWEVEDYKLAERPIALSWSANPEGPWKLISDWQPNTGEYIWQVPQGIPPRLYLRVVARDAIGNMARVDTPQPVLVDLARPSARIVDVGSGGEPNRQ